MDEKNKLWRALWNAARAALPSVYAKTDVDAIRDFRDDVCYELHGKYYREMTDWELIDTINKLNTRIKRYASKQQVNLFKHYAVAVAVELCEMDEWEYEIERNGEFVIKSGEDLREWLREVVEAGEHIPKVVVRRLFSEYINPRSHKYLIEAGFKHVVRNERRMYYERLTSVEMQAIINRWAAIYQEVCSKRLPPLASVKLN